MMPKEIRCKECNKRPEEIEEYVDLAEATDTTPDEAVIQEEGTYNPDTKLFYCTECYAAVGMPLGKA